MLLVLEFDICVSVYGIKVELVFKDPFCTVDPIFKGQWKDFQFNFTSDYSCHIIISNQFSL